MATQPPRIFFTAFEPSGDALAAPMIQQLLALDPSLQITAFGGPKMQAAGAQLIETTTDHAAMLTAAVAQLRAHRSRLQRLTVWLSEHPIDALVPVDSPAANWSICKRVRQTHPQAKIVHLVAPQLWAWAPWRIHKLRRLTDHVLCLLPFEPDWFAPRQVPATFVGHPLFDPIHSPPPHTPPTDPFPQGRPKLALLPGSRHGEIQANWPTMLQACMSLQQQHPALQAIAAISKPDQQEQVRSLSTPHLGSRSWPSYLEIQADQTGEVLDWADLALVVSGTATLQAAAHRTPMVVLYNVSPWAWHLWGRWLVHTRTFSLPNLVLAAHGQHQPVPELVPHFAAVAPVVDALNHLIRDPAAMAQQQQGFDFIAGLFADRPFSHTAATKLLETLDHARLPVVKGSTQSG